MLKALNRKMKRRLRSPPLRCGSVTSFQIAQKYYFPKRWM